MHHHVCSNNQGNHDKASPSELDIWNTALEKKIINNHDVTDKPEIIKRTLEECRWSGNKLSKRRQQEINYPDLYVDFKSFFVDRKFHCLKLKVKS
jgi:hypothetical protein